MPNLRVITVGFCFLIISMLEDRQVFAEGPTGLDYADKAGVVCSKVGTLSRNGSGTITLEGIEYKFEGNGAFEAYLGASLISKDKYSAKDYNQCLQTLTEFFLNFDKNKDQTLLRTDVTSNSENAAQFISQTSPQKYIYSIMNRGDFPVRVRVTPGGDQFATHVVEKGASVMVMGVDIRVYLEPGTPAGASSAIEYRQMNAVP